MEMTRFTINVNTAGVDMAIKLGPIRVCAKGTSVFAIYRGAVKTLIRPIVERQQ